MTLRSTVMQVVLNTEYSTLKHSVLVETRATLSSHSSLPAAAIFCVLVKMTKTFFFFFATVICMW